MTVSARASGLDLFKAAPGASARPGAYTTGQLADFVTRGLAYRLPSGKIAAVVDPQDLNYWIAECKASYGKGSGAPEDSAGLRSFVQRRASALGLSHLIGSWSVPQSRADTGKSVPTPALAELAKTASLSGGSVARGLTELAKQGRLGELQRDVGVLAKAVAITSPAAQEQMAKAARYEAKADLAIDPADRRGYLELARLEREKAGTR